MTTPGTELVPTGPDPRIDHRDPPSPPRSLAQSSRSTSPPQGSLRSSVTAVHKLNDRLKPAASVKRYERSVKLEPPYINVNLPSLTTSFGDGEEPQGWTSLAHPEGALYWFYKWQDGERVMPVYTDAYLYEKEISEEVEGFREAIFGEILNKADKMPVEWELVLDPGDDEHGERVCYYYFVNRSNRSLFWLHDFDLTPLLYGLKEVKSMRRIKQAMESFYWNHWEMFPHDREVPGKLLNELIGIMVHAGLDDMTSHGSTSVYSGDELQKFISYVEQIRSIDGADGYSACVVGRLMKFFTQGRWINFFGQREARLSADQSIFKVEDRKRRTWLIKSMSILMFFAPEVHLKALDAVYTDFVVCQHKWGKFICKVQNEWRELGRIGTVLLTANVAFLAIPSVDNATDNSTSSTYGGGYLRTPVQVTSFMSVVFSMGCLVIGQLLLRHHMIRPQDSAEEVDKYLRSYHHTHRGLETLAILYSLPYSLLLWAIASFFVAFVFVALVNTEGEWQRYPTAAVMFVFIVLLIWCIWTTWEGRADFVERVCHFKGGSPASGQGEHTPLQPEQHDGPETSQFRSVRVDLDTD